MDRQSVAIEVKKALSETVLLSDGSRGFVITEVHGFMQERWECHVCSRIIATERAMLMHLSHPLHMSKMRASHHPVENFKKKLPKDDSPKKNIEDSKNKKEEKSWELSDNIRPGEPVPPGMEDVVKKVCQIQDTLDSHTGPLIGIEYIVELISTEEEGEPKYICLLCEKKGDPRSVMVHLTSHNHALRYISCFFRTAGNAINMIPKIRENRKGLAMAVQKIAEEIEKHFGRLKPTIAAAESFTQQKYEILRSIDEKEHFRETPSTTFIEYCTPEKIKEYAKLAELEFNSLKNKNADENDMNMNNEKPENDNRRNSGGKGGEPKPYEPRHPDNSSKLSFSIGKPERSFGRNKSGELNNSNEKKDEDEVIFVASSNDPIEIPSMSSISSASDDEMKDVKFRERSRSRSRGRIRRQSPIRRRSPPRRRSPMYRDRDTRYRSRSRSRSRGRYYREKDRYSSRSGRDRDLDRIYGRDRRSRSKEKIRYERGRIDRDRYRRSISNERERRRMSPRSLKEHSPLSKGKHLKSPEPKRKKAVSEYQSKMDAYRAKLHDLEVEMDNKLKYYRERPEKHPQYSEEWKSFWNRRYKELQQSGKDPTGYDFKPEWIVFWDERVKNMHEEELAAKKEELKIFLPVEDKGPSCDLQDISPPTPESAKDVTVDDIKNTWKALTGSDIKAPPRARSPSPDTKSPISRRSPSPWEERTKSSRKSAPTYIADPPIVHCLRMLSVLEQQLGSLGPKALDLLSKAILMEKVKHNESMVLLQDADIHIFFETVKEKIRGQLIAGIVVRHLVNSCRSLITAIENMLAANPLKPKALIQSKQAYNPIQPEPVKVAGVGLVNKMAVAQQIAEVLISQGRTDVSQQELEELINAVVGIASTSNANINQPSASFISQLNIQKSTASSHINELLSNLISSAQQKVPSHTDNALTQATTPSSSVPDVSNSRSEMSSVFNSQAVSSLSTQSSMKAFTEAVSAAKATISEQTTPLSKEKILFPIDELEKDTDEESNYKISDDELKERLMKFKTLSRDEQQSLIASLKELENKEPERVEKLRKYVTLGLAQGTNSSVNMKPEVEIGRLSPFSSRAGGTNPAPEDKKKPMQMDSDHEDDDDDYSVEDVYKSVSEKLKKKESERKSDFRINPAELFDENSTSSRQSFSKPGKELSPVKNFNSDLRYTNSSQTKNDYSMYSVSETISNPSTDRFHPPAPQQQPVDNTYKNWEGAARESSQWPGNKSWPQGTQEAYPSVVRPPAYSTNNYEGTGYTQGMPPYKPAQAPYYGGDHNFPPPGPNGNPQYSNAQPYQTAPPYDNSGAPLNYNYQKMQGQGYYGNYRQY